MHSFCQIKSDITTKKNNQLIDDLNLISLLLSFDYSNNTKTFNTSEQLSQPFYSSSVIFIRNNLDLTFTSLAVEKSDDHLNGTSLEYDLSAGYTIYLNKNMHIYPAYTHMEYSANANTMRRYLSDIIQLDINYDYKELSFFLSSGFLKGIKNTFCFTLSNSYNLYVNNFPFKGTYLSFHPELDFNISDINLYNYEILSNYEIANIIEYAETRYDLRFPVLTSLRWYNRNDRPGVEEIKNIFTEDLKNYKPYLFNKRYKLSSINILIPVYFTAGNFGFNTITYLFVPAIQSELYENQIELYFNAGISYMITF